MIGASPNHNMNTQYDALSKEVRNTQIQRIISAMSQFISLVYHKIYQIADTFCCSPHFYAVIQKNKRKRNYELKTQLSTSTSSM